jgi:hypothetical protein
MSQSEEPLEEEEEEEVEKYEYDSDEGETEETLEAKREKEEQAKSAEIRRIRQHRLTENISTKAKILLPLRGWGDFCENLPFNGNTDEDYVKKIPNCVSLGKMAYADALALSIAPLPFYVFCLFTDGVVLNVLREVWNYSDLDTIYLVKELDPKIPKPEASAAKASAVDPADDIEAIVLPDKFKDNDKIKFVDYKEFPRLLQESQGRIFLCGHGKPSKSGNPSREALTISSTLSLHNMLLLHELVPLFPQDSDVIIGMCFSGLIAEVQTYRLNIPPNVLVSFVSTTTKSQDSDALTLLGKDYEFRKTNSGGKRFNRKRRQTKHTKRKRTKRKQTKCKRSRRML